MQTPSTRPTASANSLPPGGRVAAERDALLAALQRTQAVVEFALDGTLLTANENFRRVMGYAEAELAGMRHAAFVTRAHAGSDEYRGLWQQLRAGVPVAGRFKRLRKDGSVAWLEATYTPMLDMDGRPYKVVKFATDITEAELRDADFRGKMAAIARIQAVIEFDLDGHILSANDNFLRTMGYRGEEILGKHHALFVTDEEQNTPEYRAFWRSLASGEPQVRRFRRVRKDGREVWLEASYNPILDRDGRPCKVVKFATDITEAEQRDADFRGKMAAISRIQAVIEFDLGGHILSANENFLSAMGYTEREIVGQHHAMFVAEDEQRSPAYREFWRALAAGEPQVRRFKRYAKGRREVWLQASYNPIFDSAGRVLKVVKFATDITSREALRAQLHVSADALAAASEDLGGVASNMLSNADYANTQTDAVAASAETVSASMHSVAAATEQMSATVKEIARNASQAARVAMGAVRTAEDTNRTVSELGHSSTEIGKVVKTITSIAQQTNLLALNATIEAARAGESGKGFAVVANEVKELAKQTATATEDIGKKIESIQSNTRGAVEAIREICTVIGQINDFQNTIASAVEEQAATTNEIAQNASAAASTGTDISRSVAVVSEATRVAATGASRTMTAARDLSELAGQLRSALSRVDTMS
jgi:methyl-accepting chemotaxis protein